MTVQEWQDRLDKEFPDGAIVTQVEDVPEDTSDSVSFVTPMIKVLSVDTQGVPTARVFPATFSKDVTFTIADFEPFAQGVFLVTQQDTDDPQFLLNNKLAPHVAQVMRELREDQWQQ